MKKVMFLSFAIAMVAGIAIAASIYTNSIPMNFTCYPHHAHKVGFPFKGMVLNDDGKTVVSGYGNFVSETRVETPTNEHGKVYSRVTVLSTNIMYNSSSQRLEEPSMGIWFTPSQAR